MALLLNEDESFLAETARDFVAENAPVSQLRALRDAGEPGGFDEEMWKQMVELGWPGIAVPEALGGAGLGQAALGVVMEAMGERLAASPLLGSVALGINALILAGGDDGNDLVSQVVRGEKLLALAFEETARFSPHTIETTARAEGGGWEINGSKRFVLDGQVADELIVLTRTSEGTHSRGGLTLLRVSGDAPGLCITPTRNVDSRGAAQMSFAGVRVGPTAQVGEVDGAADLLDAVLDRASAALAAEMLGTATAAFDQTLEYLKVRQQFGVPIGSFQALKHRAARSFVALELSRSLVRDALQALDDGREDAAMAVSAAKAQMSETLGMVTAEALQIFGGIGMTDEQDIGLYFKRARVACATFGDAAYHRARVASAAGI